jgi:ATP-dependent Zn protease
MAIAEVIRVAIHEAGHAVMEHHVGKRLTGVSLATEPDLASNNWAGRVRVARKKMNFEQPISSGQLMEFFRAEAFIFLGGLAAEYIDDGKPDKIDTGGAKNDLKILTGLFNSVLPSKKMSDEALIDIYFEEVVKVCQAKWSAVEALAEALTEKWSLSGEEATSIIEANL